MNGHVLYKFGRNKVVLRAVLLKIEVQWDVMVLLGE